MNLGALNSEQMRLIARVLVMHYEEGHSQADIAKELELSTAKVNRLMKQGRELGMVHITIKTPLVRLFDLENAISKRWNLKKCLVLPTVEGSPEITLNEVGKGAANLLLNSIRDGDTIAISGGKTISAIIENMLPEQAYDVTVVPMTGGIQGKHYTDVNHIATSMAERLNGKATLIHAPLHAASKEERDIIMSLQSVSTVMDEAHRAAVAVVGLGAVVGDNATYYEAHPVSEEDRSALYASGVRSELLGHLVKEDGSLSDSDLNSRLVSLSPEKMVKIPVCIGVAVGSDKVEPIIAALNGSYVNALVTDEQTAAAMLEKEKVHA
ncbi:sugar-binding transcriptional regulator [Rhodobacteraceae bacterium RKSG542]|uniref:sugar-binding transcriptional regulator n=1 Tax=Pseudovibrio flavus TaxID=2529854 RepID=UPI0012BC8AF5|nr:sugar-binding transcriptional regulator [Pseudovibrio flavus]MTI17297.1 sugar-binding transcriptional regulator [Pseudovibrio flavus]